MAQFALPSSDVTTTNWTRSTGTNAFYTYIDETVADSNDYLSTTTTNSGLEVGLGSVTDPVSSSSHIVRVQLWALGGGGAAERGTVLLLQGATTIATPVSNASLTRTTPTTVTYTLTAGEADAITNYGDLRLRFTATTLAAGESMVVGWGELEVPDVTATRRIFII